MREFKINPLNVVESRRQECLLPHMSVIYLDPHSTRNYDKSKILFWIDEKLKGRYWYGCQIKLVDNRTLIYDTIAFEDPQELTIFLISCPHMAKIEVD